MNADLQEDIIGSTLILLALLGVSRMLPPSWRKKFWTINFVLSGITSIPKALTAPGALERSYHAGWVIVGFMFGLNWVKKESKSADL